MTLIKLAKAILVLVGISILVLLIQFVRGFDESRNFIQNEAKIIYSQSKDVKDTAVNIAERVFFLRIKGPKNETHLMFYPVKGGVCGDIANKFMSMMDFLKLPVRKVGTSGEDHFWNEFLLNGTWVHIDASANDIPILNDSGIYYRPENQGGWGRNLSYVYAEYPNGTRIDVTAYYVPASKIGNVTVIVTDKNDRPMNNIHVYFYSKFLMTYYKTNSTYKQPLKSVVCTTDIHGECAMALGQNNFTIGINPIFCTYL